MSLTYAGGPYSVSGDLARGVGIGNDESDTSPGDGGGRLLKLLLTTTGLAAVEVLLFDVGSVSSVLDRSTGVGLVLGWFCAESELALAYSGRARSFDVDVAAYIIAMAAAEGVV